MDSDEYDVNMNFSWKFTFDVNPSLQDIPVKIDNSCGCNCSENSYGEVKRAIDISVIALYDVPWADNRTRLAELLWLAGRAFEHSMQSWGQYYNLGIYRKEQHASN